MEYKWSSMVRQGRAKVTQPYRMRSLKPDLIRLRRMTPVEYAKFTSEDLRLFAEENVKSGRWPANRSITQARRAHRELLPDGQKTRGHYFYSSESLENGNLVAYSWLSMSGKGRLRQAFIFSLIVPRQYRGRGYGKATLDALEEVVRRMGAVRIELHVFGRNKKASDMYERSGYRVLGVNMGKVL